MRVRRSMDLSLMLAFALLAAVSCGGGGDEGVRGSSTGDPSSGSGGAAEKDPGDAKGSAETPAVSSLGDVRSAVVRIEGYGEDPWTGEQISYTGSGFLVDPSGTVVTNNHVVTGMRDVEVHVEGEHEPRRAEKLGASECSDLAVVDVEGGGFPYLAFGEEEAEADLPVESAGFPVVPGDEAPPYSQTAGQVVRTQTGEGNNASLASMIVHDATIEGGNSGGPLVDERGRVVGVNFASRGDGESNPTNQVGAIPSDEAQEVLPALREGRNVEYMGTNPESFYNPQSGAHGILVQALEEGSAAGDAGVRAGDVVVRLGERKLAAEGTMAEYCDVLRGHGGDRAEAPLPIRVLRTGPDRDAGEYMEGEIGGESLRPTGEAIRVVLDDSETLAVWTPIGWERTTGAPTRFPAARSRADLTAQASAEPGRRFSIDGGGVALSASRELAQRYTAEEFLDLWTFSESCRSVRREPYDDGAFTGTQDRYAGCGRGGTENTVVAATPEGGEYMVVVNVVTAPDEAGRKARDLVLSSFRVAGEGPIR